ncbi:PTS sugar transporter subunit IIA [Sporosarcina sp. BI001-red]|uniref:PTS sugar transporter subunit IIA n=1 Tax=Sporosarcina sp. BI001-red TaxID=2282866 RepID=UPI000E280724|nr:PTS sugar transporter subunit IIA [Sporosarcina sp. BI001-red]REB08770.1 PTS sugar transporter subunit IIA [Sporosarcina sp. BI001-red]
MLVLTEGLVELNVEAKDAEDAIRKAGQLLVNEGLAEARYIDAMVKGFQDIGPYIVVAPNIAFPHARPEAGVIEKGVSIIRLSEPVKFGHPTNDPITLVCALCGVDSKSHIEMLQALATLLRDEDKLKTIMNPEASKQDVLAII